MTKIKETPVLIELSFQVDGKEEWTNTLGYFRE